MEIFWRESRGVGLPEHFAEPFHLLVCADGDAEHLVERWKRASHGHAAPEHFFAKLTHVAADVHHHKIGVRFEVADPLSPQPIAELATNARNLGAALRDYGVSVGEGGHGCSQPEHGDHIVEKWADGPDQVWAGTAKPRAGACHAVNLRKGPCHDDAALFPHKSHRALNCFRLRIV